MRLNFTIRHDIATALKRIVQLIRVANVRPRLLPNPRNCRRIESAKIGGAIRLKASPGSNRTGATLFGFPPARIALREALQAPE